MKFKSQLVVGLALVTGLNTVSAQVDTTKKSSFLDRLTIGVNGGAILTYTDIKQYYVGLASQFHSELGGGLGINTTYAFNSVFGIQGQFNGGNVHGSNRDVDKKYFDGDFYEGSLNLHVNLNNLLFPARINKTKFSTYGYVGLGWNTFRCVLRNLAGDGVVYYQGYDSPTLSLDKRTTEWVMPLGLGIKYQATEHIALSIETSFRFMNSDKLDATKVHNSSNDVYQYSNFGVSYNFGAKKQVTDVSQLADKIATVSEMIDGFGDKDGDGVADKYDKDNNTVAGAKTYGDGTAMDTDGDGVPDYMDQEKFSANGAKVRGNGVEVDADGDGVGDSRDLEPNTAKGAQVDAKGVTIQTGGPMVASKTDAAGYQPSGLPSIYFQMNSSVVEYNNYPGMTTIAQALKANAKLKLVVVGHADNVGSAEYNKKLALKRSEAVVSHLVKVYGIDKARLSTDSKGSGDVLTKGKGSIVDRRVDFLIGK